MTGGVAATTTTTGCRQLSLQEPVPGPTSMSQTVSEPSFTASSVLDGSQRDRSKWSPAARELVGGVLAGAVNVASGYPFDTLKVRLQASTGGLSMSECFWSIWRTEGVRGFYRGLSSPLIGGAAETGVNYLVYSRILDMFAHQQQVEGLELLQQHLPATLQQQHDHYHFQHHHHQQQQQGDQQQQQQPALLAVPVAGAMAGVALSVILSPTELVKCRMQVGQHTSPLACLHHILQSEGIRGLGRGFTATVCREVPGNALFFTVYEGLRRTWLGGRPSAHGSSSSSSTECPDSGGSGGHGSKGNPQGSSTQSSAWSIVQDAGGAILCGGLAGVTMWGAILPLDVAKTRIQTGQPGSPWDTDVRQQLLMLWKEGGRRSLWAGLSPTLVRAFPANACQWLAWEVAMRQLLPGAAGQGSSSCSSSGLQLRSAAPVAASSS